MPEDGIVANSRVQFIALNCLRLKGAWFCIQKVINQVLSETACLNHLDCHPLASSWMPDNPQLPDSISKGCKKI